MAKKSASNAAPKASTIVHEEPSPIVHEERQVPIREIFADYSWNSRGALDLSDGKEDYTSTRELAISIAEHGQDTPIVTRGVKKAATPYATVAGFRRHAAYTLLDKPDFEGGKYYDPARLVRIDYRGFISDAEAREINLRENFSREDVDAADKVIGVRNFLRDWEAGQPKGTPPMTTVELASRLGVSQKSASRFTVLLSKLSAPLVDRWGASRLRPTMAQMQELAEKPQSEQDEAFSALLAAKAPAAGGGTNASERGPNRWVVTAKNAAADMGQKLAALEVAGVLSVLQTNWSESDIRLLVDYKPSLVVGTGNAKDGATPEQNAAVLKAFVDSYLAHRVR